MTRILKAALLGLGIALAQPAWATPDRDADFIADQFYTHTQTSARKLILKRYVEGMIRVLSQRSVRVIDTDKYAALVPDHVVQAKLAYMKPNLKHNFLTALTPVQLADLADYLRRNSLADLERSKRARAAQAAQQAPMTSEEFSAKLENYANDKEARERSEMSRMLTVPVMLSFTRFTEVEPDLHAPYMADILAVDGVFEFPNRIVRKNLIREIKAANP